MWLDTTIEKQTKQLAIWRKGKARPGKNLIWHNV